MEVLQFMRFFFGASWDFFTEINVPGFDFSFAALFVGLFMAFLGLKFVTSMIGVGISSGPAISVIQRSRGGEKK